MQTNTIIRSQSPIDRNRYILMPLNAITLYVDFVMTLRHVHCFGEVMKRVIEARQPKYETSSYIILLIESLMKVVKSINYQSELRKLQHNSASTTVYFTNVVMPLQYQRLSFSLNSSLSDQPQMANGNSIINKSNMATLSQSCEPSLVMPQYIAYKFLHMVTDTKPSKDELGFDEFIKDRVADQVIPATTSKAVSANIYCSQPSLKCRISESGYIDFDDEILNGFEADFTRCDDIIIDVMVRADQDKSNTTILGRESFDDLWNAKKVEKVKSKSKFRRFVKFFGSVIPCIKKRN